MCFSCKICFKVFSFLQTQKKGTQHYMIVVSPVSTLGKLSR
ncbi:hypothetical protein AALP_AA8G079000 [Arabis alpina]|uniref:Uncharacterized protein n=1 Tax=Arabis alpina TaxID=50452 RepID=A0A087G5N9_ARAAL|nr:hypothetical protein AALP_AA8G079000 [Arabis alpina]